ncbi:unnamed protein product [Owenia fusiformis]|uniref:Uncharacterized protein n=1 Tax=Owenia fusiformis TaxID=6347 RepID=A0A8J1TMC6_OWEFU|nr:unnamed protein product [Owenia fusiformis]
MSSNGNEGNKDNVSDSVSGPAGQKGVYFKIQLNELWQDEVFTDVTLEVEGKQFNCHKIILAANSPYFRSLLTNGMAETTKKSIELKDVSSTTMEHILRFIYHDFKDISDIGNTNLSVKQALEALKAVDMFQIENGMKDILADYLMLNIADDNCLEIAQTAQCIGQPKLAETANEYALHHFDDVWKTDGLLELEKNCLVSYLGDDRLVVTDEENVFYAVDRWMSKAEEREEYVLELFDCVRFCFIKSKVLTDDIYTHALTNPFPCLNNYIIAAFRHQTTPCYQHEEHYYRCKPRNCETILFSSRISLPFLNRNNNDDISINFIREVLSKEQTFKMTWTIPEHTYDEDLLDSEVCLVGHNIYRYETHQFLYRYTYKEVDNGNYTRTTWTNCASPPNAAFWQGFTFTLCGDYMYLIGGGEPDGTVSSRIDMYDWRNDTWKEPQEATTALIHPVYGHLTVAAKGFLYIIGGCTVDKSSCRFLQIYNSRNGNISMGPKLPEYPPKMEERIAHHGIRGVCYNEEVYCFWPLCKTISKYSPQSSQWTTFCHKEIPVLAAPTLLVKSSKILVFGGLKASRTGNKKVFEFDPESGSVEMVTSFDSPLCFGDLSNLVKNEHLKWL